MTTSALEAYVNKIEGQHRAAMANLQEQFDTLAAAHAGALDDLRRQTVRLAILERMVIPARLAPDTAEFAKFVLPGVDGPAHHRFDSAGLLGQIAERSRV